MTILLKHTTTRFGLLLLLALVLSLYHTSCLRVLIEDTLPLYRVFVNVRPLLSEQRFFVDQLKYRDQIVSR